MTWRLNGVTLDYGGTVTGTFVFDTTSNAIVDLDLAATYTIPSPLPQAISNPYTFTASNSSAMIYPLGSGIFQLEVDSGPYPPAPGQIFYRLAIPIQAVGLAALDPLATPGTYQILFGGGRPSWYEIDGCPPTIVEPWTTRVHITGGAITSVPLPSSIFLLGSGLLGLGFLRRSRKG